MPNWVQDEDKWSKAKEIVQDQYGLHENDGDKFWELVTGVYKKMKGRIKKKKGSNEYKISRLIKKYSFDISNTIYSWDGTINQFDELYQKSIEDNSFYEDENRNDIQPSYVRGLVNNNNEIKIWFNQAIDHLNAANTLGWDDYSSLIINREDITIEINSPLRAAEMIQIYYDKSISFEERREKYYSSIEKLKEQDLQRLTPIFSEWQVI